MILTQNELNRNRIISGSATLLIMALLLLFLILFQLITPNPPFPESGGGGGQELALGMVDLGNDNVDYNAMGEASNVVTEEEQAENIQTVENGEDVLLEEKPEKKETPKVTTQVVKPQVVIKEKTAAEKLAEKFKKNTGKTGGGIGENQEAGQSGSPDGDPFKNGAGGTGTGIGGGDGEGDGTGSGPGKGPGFGGGKYNVNLKGRALVKPPKLPTDLAEEGKVVVEITVDSEGTVIEANPNGRGTTTSSAILKAKAKQAALATKFNVDGKFEEQKGTITIIFTFN
jgi:outer membrane biosynthesis protein TonB